MPERSQKQAVRANSGVVPCAENARYRLPGLASTTFSQAGETSAARLPFLQTNTRTNS